VRSWESPTTPAGSTFDELKIVLRVDYEADSSHYVFSGLCVAAAAFFGFKGIHTSRRDTGKHIPR